MLKSRVSQKRCPDSWDDKKQSVLITRCVLISQCPYIQLRASLCIEYHSCGHLKWKRQRDRCSLWVKIVVGQGFTQELTICCGEWAKLSLFPKPWPQDKTKLLMHGYTLNSNLSKLSLGRKEDTGMITKQSSHQVTYSYCWSRQSGSLFMYIWWTISIN